MRYAWVVLVTLAALAMVCAGPAAAVERPLASLVPPDVSSYSELHLDRMLGKAPETAALREVFAKMQSPKVIRGMLAEDEELAQGFDEVVGVLGDLSEAVGPKVGWATWLPDMGAMMGGMMEAGEGGPPLGMMPKLLVVADVRDAAKLDSIVGQIIERLELPARVSDGEGGTRVVTFAEGMVEMIQGDDWVAIGFPPEQARKAADRATGATAKSLWSDMGYQGVIARLPQGALVTEYVSPLTVKQMLGMAQMLAPSADFAQAGDEPLGLAMGVSVDEKQGRRMVTVYYTADLNTLPYLLDAPLALQATMLYPVIKEARGSAEKAVCLSNVKNLSLAMQMYLADNNDRFPATERWVEEMMPYLRNEEVLKCPADESDAMCSYAMNEALSGTRLTEVQDPAGLVVFFETAHPGDNPVGGPDDVVSPPRHEGGNHYAFADGRAAWSDEVPNFEVK